MDKIFLNNKELTTQDRPLFIFPKSKRQRFDKSNNNNLNNLKDKTSYSSSKINNDNDNRSPLPSLSPSQETSNNLKSHIHQTSLTPKKIKHHKIKIKLLQDIDATRKFPASVKSREPSTSIHKLQKENNDSNTPDVSKFLKPFSTRHSELRLSNNIVPSHSFPKNPVKIKSNNAKLKNTDSLTASSLSFDVPSTPFTKSDSNLEPFDFHSPIFPLNKSEYTNNIHPNNGHDTINNIADSTSTPYKTPMQQPLVNQQISFNNLFINNDNDSHYTQNNTLFNPTNIIDNLDEEDNDSLFTINRNLLVKTKKFKRLKLYQPTSKQTEKIHSNLIAERDTTKRITHSPYNNNNMGSELSPIIINDKEKINNNHDRIGNSTQCTGSTGKIDLEKSTLYIKCHKHRDKNHSLSIQQSSNITNEMNDPVLFDNTLVKTINLEESILYNKTNKSLIHNQASTKQQNGDIKYDNTTSTTISPINLEESTLKKKVNKTLKIEKKIVSQKDTIPIQNVQKTNHIIKTSFNSDDNSLLKNAPVIKKQSIKRKSSTDNDASSQIHNRPFKTSSSSSSSSSSSPADKNDHIELNDILTETITSNEDLSDQQHINQPSQSSIPSSQDNHHNDSTYENANKSVCIENGVEIDTFDTQIPINTEYSSKNPIYIHPQFIKHLKKHQIDGIRFMWKQLIENSVGCVLAHSMGLGKTLQVIVLVSTIFYEIEKGNKLIPTDLLNKRILILAPLTTLSNWMNEFDYWVPSSIKSAINHIYNATTILHVNHGKKLNFLKNWYNHGGICLMGYDQYRSLLSNEKESSQYESILLNPSLFIADEGHKIKNAATNITQMVGKTKTYRRLCLTGYPLQNNLYEYYCMVNFTFPDLLGGQEYFKEEYKDPIEDVYADTSNSMRLFARKRLLQLQLMVQSYVQRKSPAILDAELYGKSEYYIHCPLTPVQFKLYISLMEMLKPNSSLFDTIAILRSICNHPSIIEKILKNRLQKNFIKSVQNLPQTDDDDNDYEDEYNAIEKSFDIESWKYSHKVMIIIAISNLCKSKKEKLVIVSHSLLYLDYLERLLSIFGYHLLRLDGNLEANSRQPIIDKFNNDPKYNIFLISSKAGGIGVNITSANRMILVDLDWNPSYDEQSIGRIYRYGQKKPVFVYRLLCHSTIESVLKAKNIHKRGISR
ncbi:P-loop containing nucleoside triphosphate hydrolase protein [Cunninghamella echinulata]|nr:P-loop containing nucleoside triphosphate hydrolase protein [Cunninghamella echinulata]